MIALVAARNASRRAADRLAEVGIRVPVGVEQATPEWVGWCDHRRLLEAIGNVPAAEVEAAATPSSRSSR